MGQRKYGIILGILFSVPVMAEDLPLFLDPVLVDEPVIQPAEQPTIIHYTWDDFLLGKPCDEDFYSLQKLPFLSPKQQFLRDNMQTYCLGQRRERIWDELLATFRQCKKNLLIKKTVQGNGLFWGYIKALPYFLFDLHNTHPNGNTLGNTLDFIQNAIQNKEPQKVLSLMQNLSTNEQLIFNPLFNEASVLVDFQNALKMKGLNLE